MIKCVIIDDESFSIKTLQGYIDLLPNLSVIHTYTSSLKALNELTNTNGFDLLFLDVDMPNLSGLDLAPALRGLAQKVVFTTAHSRYAYEAFELDADAFLLKPFTFAKFATTINKLFPVPVKEKEEVAADFILVKSKEDNLKILKVFYKDIIAFESANNYIKIHLSVGKPIISYLTLKDINELITPFDNFKQFHRAFIISVNHIRSLEGNSISMSNNISFTVGDTFKDKFSLFVERNLLKTSRTKR
jgi:DNA-binding LytR/AlgR family response regulator